MQQNFNDLNIKYLLGNASQLAMMSDITPVSPFNENIIELLDLVSHELLSNKEARQYPDVVTFAFWIRKANVIQMKEQFLDETVFRLGKGIVFHIAPSNVAVNFAYSLVAALLCGNANIVKVPSKNFRQVNIIADAFQKVLDEKAKYKPFINLIQYGHDKETNDNMSALCDVRVIWGGDETIRRIRESSIKPRTTEVTFADRFSIAYIESAYYLERTDKKAIANDFYNDTYLTDQNACTSPRIVFWGGTSESTQKAKELFWDNLRELVSEKYAFQDIFAVDKLSTLYLVAAQKEQLFENVMSDNFVTRVQVKKPEHDLLKWKCHSGFFFEYDCNDILDLKEMCNDTACQTLSYLGDVDTIKPLFSSGIKGIDRVVPMGKTMDFNFIWDGYNLIEQFTRIVDIK